MKTAIVLVQTSKKEFAPLARKVRKALIEALSVLQREDAALELHILSNRAMRAINNATRGKNEPTNVLSFEGDGFPRADVRGKTYLGEIYLAPEVIRVRGEDAIFLAIHGLLHLFHYTHEKNRDRITMEKAEDGLLAEIATRI